MSSKLEFKIAGNDDVLLSTNAVAKTLTGYATIVNKKIIQHLMVRRNRISSNERLFVDMGTGFLNRFKSISY